MAVHWRRHHGRRHHPAPATTSPRSPGGRTNATEARLDQRLDASAQYATRCWQSAGLGPGHARAAVPPAKALEDGDLRGYAVQLGLDVTAFDRDRASKTVLERIQRDVGSDLASAAGTSAPPPCSSTASSADGYDPPTLMAALAP